MEVREYTFSEASGTLLHEEVVKQARLVSPSVPSTSLAQFPEKSFPRVCPLAPASQKGYCIGKGSLFGRKVMPGVGWWGASWPGGDSETSNLSAKAEHIKTID